MSLGLGRVLGTAASKAFKANVKESAKAVGEELTTALHRIGTSARSYMMHHQPQSPTSARLAGMLDEWEDSSALMSGGWLQQFDNAAERHFKGRITPEDLYHVSDVAEGLVAPKSDAHAAMAADWKALTDEIQLLAMENNLQELQGGVYRLTYERALKGMVQTADGTMRPRSHAEAARMARRAAERPFQGREWYVPHYYSASAIQEFLDNPALVDKAAEIMLKRGYTNKMDEARNIVRLTATKPSEFRGGPLQHTRELDQFMQGGYDKDLRRVAARYFTTAARRIRGAQMFGGKDEYFTKVLLPQIEGEGGNAAVAQNVYLAMMDTAPRQWRNLAKAAGTLHSLTLLSTAGILQPSQITNVAVRAGWINTVKAMIHTAGNWKADRAFAEHAGATINTIWRDLAVESPSDITKVWMKMIGLEQLDRYNRVVAAVAGRFHAQELAGRVHIDVLEGMKPRQLYIDTLERYGISLNEVLNQGGRLTDDQVRGAGYRLARNTQFATSVLDMPEFRTSSAGPFVYLFKSFAFQQARFMKDEVIKPMRQYGAFDIEAAMMPFVNGAVGFMAMSQILPPLIRKIKGREEPDDPTVKALEDLAMVGSTGVFWDAMRAIFNGPSSVANWALGPTFGEVTQFVGSDVGAMVRGVARSEGEGLEKLGDADFEPLKKHLVRRAPFFGPMLADLWWGKD